VAFIGIGHHVAVGIVSITYCCGRFGRCRVMVIAQREQSFYQVVADLKIKSTVRRMKYNLAYCKVTARLSHIPNALYLRQVGGLLSAHYPKLNKKPRSRCCAAVKDIHRENIYCSPNNFFF